MSWWQGVRAAVQAAALLVAVAAPAFAGDTKAEPSRYYDTGRFYFYFEAGFDFVLDKHVLGDTDMHNPRGPLPFIGGAGGYNVTDHWGFELQAHGTYPDLVSNTQGKVGQYANITIVPAVKFRWPFMDGRLVPYLTGGVGGSLNELSDNGNTRVHNHIDDRATIVGSLFAGLDYFLNPNIAVGMSFGSFIYPDQGYSQTILNNKNQVIFKGSTSSQNQTRLGLMGHVTLYPGQAGEPGSRPGLRQLLFADHGPFDTDKPRFYMYGCGGDTFDFDNSFGGGVEIEAPGDYNATYGGGLGFNYNRYLGAEAQLTRRESNATLPSIGKFEQLSIFDMIPMVRFRYPLLGGRLVPYATTGVGFAFYKLNDRQNFGEVKSTTGNSAKAFRTPQLTIDHASPVTQVSLGIEYFLNHNVSFGASVPFYIYSSVDTSVIGGSDNANAHSTANFTGMAFLLEVRAYLP